MSNVKVVGKACKMGREEKMCGVIISHYEGKHQGKKWREGLWVTVVRSVCVGGRAASYRHPES